MPRRTTILGVTLLALTLVAGPAVEADDAAKSSAFTKTSKSSSRARARLQREAFPLFTNADIDTLPATGNSSLPELDDDTITARSPNRFVIIGTPAQGEKQATAPAQVGTAAAEQSKQWVERMRADRKQAARIAAAQRRARRAESHVENVIRTYRPKGSPFSTGGGNIDRLFVRGVASKTFKYDDAIREAYTELAEARAELESLLAIGDAS